MSNLTPEEREKITSAGIARSEIEAGMAAKREELSLPRYMQMHGMPLNSHAKKIISDNFFSSAPEVTTLTLGFNLIANSIIEARLLKKHKAELAKRYTAT